MSSQNKSNSQKPDQKGDVDSFITAALFRRGGLLSQSDLITAVCISSNKSKITVRKRIGARDGKDLKRVHYKEFEKYGIKDDNKKNAWVAFGDMPLIRAHISRILDGLDPNNQSPVLKLSVNELNNYIGSYALSSKQLDQLVQLLDKITNIEVVRILSGVILFNLGTYDIKPSDENALLDVAKRKIKLYPSSKAVNNKQVLEVKANLIHLLGILNDREGIYQLEQDAEKGYLANIEIARIYGGKNISRLIEEHRSELFKLEEKLLKKGKEDIVSVIEGIRSNARSELDPRLQEMRKLGIMV